MTRFNMRLVAAALVALVAVPALAQNFSDGYSFLKAVRERDGAKVNEMISGPGAGVINHRDPSSGEGALHILVRNRELTWLNVLLRRGARADIQDDEGVTPLLLAAQLGWVPGAEQLLARGANPNLANSRGETPLIYAVQGRHLPMVKLLLSKRADPNISDSFQGYSAIDYARRDPRAAQILRELETSGRPAAAPAN
jgi:uncharacterized protein